MVSDFQFRNPVLTEIEFCMNENFDSSHKDVIKINFQLTVDITRNDNTANEAVVSLTCVIGEKNSSAPYYIKAVEQAEFRWKEDIQADVDSLLHKNAPTVLLSYLRPIISQITAASPYEAFNIPFVNFAKEG